MYQHTLAVSASWCVSLEKKYWNEIRGEVRILKSESSTLGIVGPYPWKVHVMICFSFGSACFRRWIVWRSRILWWACLLKRFCSANLSWSYLTVPNYDRSASIVHAGRCNTHTPLKALSCRILWYFSWFFDPLIGTAAVLSRRSCDVYLGSTTFCVDVCAIDVPVAPWHFDVVVLHKISR